MITYDKPRAEVIYIMDNDSIFYDKNKFDSIWKRVMDSSGSGSDSDVETLRGFLKDEYHDWQLYRIMAGRTKGEAREFFRQAANDEHSHFHSLRTRYYILTGKTYDPGNPPAAPTASLSSILRERYEEESAGAAAYLKAAETTKKPDIAKMYRSYSADETHHARQILKLINKLMD